MSEELLQSCVRNDAGARRQFIEQYYGTFMGMSRRYAKSNEQANTFFHQAFIDLFKDLVNYDSEQNFDEWVKNAFLTSIVHQLKNCKAEYYVTTTTRVDDKKANPDLFHESDGDEVNNLAAEDYIRALQQLPASFRAVYNMNVVEEYSLDKISTLLEVSESSAQNTLERAKNQLAKNLQHQMQGYA
ncbi:MAG: RNA polymerase sigma factor [Bacteroidia bacterium]